MSKERVPLRAFGQGQQGGVGGGAEDVSRHFGDSGLVEAPENRLAGSVAEQLGGSAPQIAAGLGGAEGQHPADMQRSQPRRQAAHRCPGTAISPLQVVEADQDWLAQSGLLKQRLDVLQQPVTLLAGGARIPECRTLEQRLRPPEQRVHQYCQLHSRIAGLGHAVADAESGLPRSRHGLLQQAALTESRAAFNQPAGPGPAPQPGQVIVQRSHLAVPAAQRVRHGSVRSINLPGSHDGHAVGPAIPRHGRLRNGTIAPLRHGHTGDGTGCSRPGASARRLRGADPAAGGKISHRAEHLADRPRRRYGGAGQGSSRSAAPGW